jgi:hypothetical protein
MVDNKKRVPRCLLWSCLGMWMIPTRWGSPSCINVQYIGAFLTWPLGHKMECFHTYLGIKVTHYFLSSWPYIKKIRSSTQCWSYCTTTNTKGGSLWNNETNFPKKKLKDKIACHNCV